MSKTFRLMMYRSTEKSLAPGVDGFRRNCIETYARVQ
jgi:hypothetical protein